MKQKAHHCFLWTEKLSKHNKGFLYLRMARGDIGGQLVISAGAKGLRPVAWLGWCMWVDWSCSLRIKTG